jgi:outer membrane protein OmpA-like peptidoglycan-associated protein
MTLKHRQSLWLWAGALALLLVALLPGTGWSRAAMALVVVGGIALAWKREARFDAQLRQELAGEGSLQLPAASYKQPVVLMCGDDLDHLFVETPADQPALRVTDQGCYLRVAQPEQLPHLAQSILALRPQWGGQLSAMLVLNPSAQTDAGVLAGYLRTFNYQVGLIRKRGIALPWMLVTYLQAARGIGPWFSWENAGNQCFVRENGACSGTDDWQRQGSDAAVRAERMQVIVQLNSATAWLDDNVLAHFCGPETRHAIGRPLACAFTLTPDMPAVTGNLWQRWLSARTGLLAAAEVPPGAQARWSFPDPLLHLLPVQARCSSKKQAQIVALWLFALASIAALGNSAWQNKLLLREVSDDLRHYHSIAVPTRKEQPEFAQREQALSVLHQDAERLNHYYRNGEPLSLGLGLYSAEPLRQWVLATIADHSQPSMMRKASRTVRLDSLSLFASASAELKPESTKVLIDALVGIKAQPGWLIVIAGHTDAVGNDQHNLRLSRARAVAVREWMQRMSDLPDSCFAIQGFGKSQPIASNDTEAGRQANRRVEIRLLPEVGACALPTAAADV